MSGRRRKMIISKKRFDALMSEATSEAHKRGFLQGYRIAQKKAYRFISEEISKAIERQKKIDNK